jgi:hypothetical protein
VGIIIYSVEPGKAPVEVRPKSGEALQAKVSCEGDIAVQPFYPDENTHGIAWLLLCQGPAGEPGRDINGEVDEGPRLLQEQPGVLIGAKDPKSLDVIINALDALRRRLRGEKPGGILSDLEKRIRRDIEEQEDQAFIAELRKAGDQLVKDTRAYGEHLVEHAKGGMSGARPGVDLPEKPFRHCPAPDRPKHEVAEAMDSVMKEQLRGEGRDGGLGEPPRRRGTPWGKVTQ